MKTILVIEDEKAVRTNIIKILEVSGYKVLSAENGRLGVDIARQSIPDLIISDIMMPELDGYGVLSELSTNTHTADIPFLFLSAKADRNDIREAMNLGADDYLTKPFRIKELLDAIDIRLKKHAEKKKSVENTLSLLRANLSMSLPHEFLTPMTGIIGFSDILLKEAGNLSAEDQAEMFREINISAKRLLHLIQNFLLFARLEKTLSSPEQMQSMRQEICHSIMDIAESAAMHVLGASGRMASVQWNIQHDASCHISTTDLTKVVEELLSNAAKFSDINSTIEINGLLDSQNKLYSLSIADHGCGMSIEEITKIGAYMQFNRDKQEQQGSGLGLAIVQRIMQIYQGQLIIRQRQDMKPGLEVCVQIPVFDE
jgi:signal transduction histidine kinase